MKKIFAFALAVLMIFSLVACTSAPDENSTVGEHMLYQFNENADKSAQEIADILVNSDVLTFMGLSIPVEEGYLSGFGNAEITGFDEGVMFGPAISTIPFIGYVFDLSDDTDVDEFMQTLEDNADTRFNICTEADQVVIDNKGDKVIVVITPEKFEEEQTEDEFGNPVEGDMPVYGEEFVDEFAE